MIKKTIVKVFGINNIKYLRSFLPTKQEKALMKQREVFYSQFLTNGATFFDVGANYGNRIQPLIDLGLKIVAIEPQSKCVKYLKRKFGNKIKIVEKGLGAKEGLETLYISDSHVLSTFSKDWIDTLGESDRFKEYQWNDQESVQMTTLDNLIKEFGQPEFIKIDVEGFELEVLKGLSKPVNLISLEYAVPEYSENVINCIHRLVEISNGDIVCNYSIGESMTWALNEWLSPEDMIKEIESEKFTKTSFGDIYIKHQGQS